MHGQRRLPPGAEEEPEFQAKLKERNVKAAKAQAATKAVLKARAAGDYGPAVLMGSKAVLAVFPDLYSLWNVRREALGSVLEGGGSAADQAAQEELALTRKCLEEHPKSYSAWHHRRWVVGKGHVDLDAELKTLEEFLHPTRGDAKNFHAWKYRYWLVALMQRSDEDELQFCQRLIKADRSNFSAWHYRSVLLPRVHAQRGHQSVDQLAAGEPAHINTAAAARPAQTTEKSVNAPEAAAANVIPLYELKAEFDFLHQTLVVSPGDASVWSYHRWLCHNVMGHATAQRDESNAPHAGEGQTAQSHAAAHDAKNLLDTEEQRCSDILASERERAGSAAASVLGAAALHGSIAWPLQRAAELSQWQRQLLRRQGCSGERERLKREASMYEELIAVDPRRAGFYQDQLQLSQQDLEAGA